MHPTDGMDFTSKVRSTFSTPVHHPSATGGFSLVVSFGRSNFRLDRSSINNALISCIGDDEADFHVTLIRERVFKFLVFSRAVGFMVYNLRSYACSSFQCFFHLWGFGGPNWQREFDLWSFEEQASWTPIARRKTPLTGANAIPVATGRSFADVAKCPIFDLNSSDHVATSIFSGQVPARLNYSNSCTGPNLVWRPIIPEQA
jgi:hypothetical protein